MRNALDVHSINGTGGLDDAMTKSDLVAEGSVSADAVSEDSVRSVYKEVCTSYHAIDEFRMKLLGLLPLASIVGLIAVQKGAFGAVDVRRNELVAYAGFFASVFTLALFVYEIRGIRRSHRLVKRGKELEVKLGVRGQFWLCTADAPSKEQSLDARGQQFNSTTAACFMYGLVFSAWLFLAVRYGFAWNVHMCALFAIAFGTAVGAGAYRLVRPLIPA
jgi:hypothetical protein